MKRPLKNIWFLFMIIMAFPACSGLKYLPAGEKLYTGSEVILVSGKKLDKKEKKFIQNIEKTAIRPNPNQTILGMRPKLWMYVKAGENPTSKIKKWLRDKGEAPVLLSSIKPGVTGDLIDAKLFNIGIFNAYTESKIVEKGLTGKVIYTSYIHDRYKIKELNYSISEDSISLLIQNEKNNSIIKKGEDYNLGTLKNERIRIDAILKNKGYFYFNPDFLLFKADTSKINHSVTLQLTLKDSVPNNALTAYRINKVTIDQGEQTEMSIRSSAILRSVFLRKNEIYTRINHTITLNRLMSMDNFKFVQIKFTESDTVAKGYLDVVITMTPLPKHSFSAEVELVSKSNNYTGPRGSLSILNRNAFRGAELLRFNMAGSFEAQLSGASKNLFSYSWNPQVELNFPLFLVPFKITSAKSIYVPNTRILLSYNYLKRVGYFDMRTFQIIYGYKWKKNIRVEQEFNPVNVSYTTIGNKSQLFNDLLDSNPFLKKSYEEQFIAGASYSFTYDEQVIPGKKVQYYLHLISETAGNVFSLSKVIVGKKISSADPVSIAGSVYSQYARVSIDGRVYYNFVNQDKIVFRLFAGVAKPYGNSSTLPYIKQFFSGGPSSIRAFQINSLGPGTYHQTMDNTGFLQLGGDVKLEMNAEYRFSIFKFLKGAIFADAGNVWLLKSNPSNIGSAFSFSGFAEDLALGAGAGLRIDVSFFILRFDLAMPLRKPWLDLNNRWVINQINFGDASWRRENLIFNVAIGYPF